MQTEGVILAGGFVQHPMQWGVRLAEKLAGSNSLSLLTRIIFGYAKTARFRFRHSPEKLASIDEFVARRTDLDRQAATWRLRLVGQSDARETARQIEAPVFALTGVLDPIVPWPFVFPWLHRHCPALHDSRIVRQADHNVLGTAPQLSVEQVLRWMQTVSK
jgi:pimeloyl-ACP methyl ester carboxylesterase